MFQLDHLLLMQCVDLVCHMCLLDQSRRVMSLHHCYLVKVRILLCHVDLVVQLVS